MSPDFGMTFRLGRVAKLRPNLSWLSLVWSVLVELFAGFSGVSFFIVSLLIGGPIIDSDITISYFVLFWVDKSTVRVFSFLFEGVSGTVKGVT